MCGFVGVSMVWMEEICHYGSGSLCLISAQTMPSISVGFLFPLHLDIASSLHSASMSACMPRYCTKKPPQHTFLSYACSTPYCQVSLAGIPPLWDPLHLGVLKAIQASILQLHSIVSVGLHSGTPFAHAWLQRLSLVTKENSIAPCINP